MPERTYPSGGKVRPIGADLPFDRLRAIGFGGKLILPIVIEIVDSEEKIREFLPQLDGMIGDGLITLEKAEVLVYRANNPLRSGENRV